MDSHAQFVFFSKIFTLFFLQLELTLRFPDASWQESKVKGCSVGIYGNHGRACPHFVHNTDTKKVSLSTVSKSSSRISDEHTTGPGQMHAVPPNFKRPSTFTLIAHLTRAVHQKMCGQKITICQI